MCALIIWYSHSHAMNRIIALHAAQTTEIRNPDATKPLSATERRALAYAYDRRIMAMCTRVRISLAKKLLPNYPTDTEPVDTWCIRNYVPHSVIQEREVFQRAQQEAKQREETEARLMSDA